VTAFWSPRQLPITRPIAAFFADDDESPIDEENRGQIGFRVPTIMASPYARPGFVDHRIYDHTSILRFIESGRRLFGRGCEVLQDLISSDEHVRRGC